MTLTFALTLCVALSFLVTADADHMACHITGDPHVTSISESYHASLFYPCEYLAASVDVGPGSFNVLVYASNALAAHGARYFVNSVRVELWESNVGSSYFADADRVLNADPSEASSAWQFSGTLPNYASVDFEMDGDTRTATLLIRNTFGDYTSLRIDFFPRLDERGLRRERGVIITDKSNIDVWAMFPLALCSAPADFTGTDSVPGPWSDDTKVLIAALSQGGGQGDNELCQTMVDSYASCGSTDRNTAVAYCQEYLHGKVDCMRQQSHGNRGAAVAAFRDCMEYMCGQGADQCDDCALGPLCDDGECNTLDSLNCVEDNLICLEGSACDQSDGRCRLVATEGQACAGCHKVCVDDLICNGLVSECTPGNCDAPTVPEVSNGEPGPWVNSPSTIQSEVTCDEDFMFNEEGNSLLQCQHDTGIWSTPASCVQFVWNDVQLATSYWLPRQPTPLNWCMRARGQATDGDRFWFDLKTLDGRIVMHFNPRLDFSGGTRYTTINYFDEAWAFPIDLSPPLYPFPFDVGVEFDITFTAVSDDRMQITVNGDDFYEFESGLLTADIAYIEIYDDVEISYLSLWC